MNAFVDIVRGLDVRFYYFLNSFAGNWFLDRFLSHLSGDFLLRGAIPLAGYWYLWFRRGPDIENRRRKILSLLLAALLAILVCRMIADLLPFRTRPIFDHSITHRAYSFTVAPDLEDWSSFPSDHAAFFVALAIGLAHFFRRYRLPILLFPVFTVCLLRAYFGVHYASDLLAGAAIGAAASLAAIKSDLLQFDAINRVLEFEKSQPGIFYFAGFLSTFEMASIFTDVRNLGRSIFHVAAPAMHRHLPFLAVALLTAVAFIASMLLLRLAARGRRISGIGT